jgi:hypothetical protein
MTENNYPAGFFFNLPHANAPEFVKGNANIKKDMFLEWLKEQKTDSNGFVKLQFKVGRDGKGYASLDTYGLQGSTQPRCSQSVTSGIEYPSEEDTIDPDSIPF